MTLKKEKKNITKYQYKKIIVIMANEVHTKITDNGTKMSINECRKKVHHFLKKSYNILEK